MIGNIKYILFATILSFSYLQSKSQRQIYAVIVGISDYKNDNLNMDLNYCDDDAALFQCPEEGSTVFRRLAASRLYGSRVR